MTYWRTVEGFSNYAVNEQGNVKNVKRVIS